MLGGNTVQPNVVLPDSPALSVAVTVTSEVPSVVGVPDTAPSAPRDRPTGRPVVDHVYGAVPPNTWPAYRAHTLPGCC